MLEFCIDQGDRAFVLSCPPSGSSEEWTFQFVGGAPPLLKRPFRRVMAAPLLALPLPERIRLSVIDWVHGLRIREAFTGETWTRLVVHDFELLPLGLRLAKGAPVYFDAREFYPKQNEESWGFRVFETPTRQWLCTRYLPQCRALFTVSNGLRRCYRESFGVDATLLRSVPNRRNLQPQPVKPGRIRLVHHGVANKNRGLDQLIEMTHLLDDRFTLDLYLTGNVAVIARLKKLSADYPKVSIRPPVAYAEIIPTLNAYDVGIAFFPPVTLNLKYCLPNKFFEFIQARLAVVVGPSPDMADLVRRYAVGFVTDDFAFSTLAQNLNAWDEKAVAQAKEMSHLASEELCFEREKEIIGALWQATGDPIVES